MLELWWCYLNGNSNGWK